MVYRSSCRNSFFNETSKAKKTDFGLWNNVRISLFGKQLKSSRINPNISKCREFGESTVMVLGHKK